MSSELSHFFETLTASGYQGDYSADYPERLIAATDNSIYQLQPQAILYPRTGEDLALAVRIAARYQLPLTPRGGGTGTNAQSLTAGIVVDVSRYLDKIISFNAEHETVTVQPGVILSRLNAFLKPHGYFFPPTVSTANRATIGGMIATDASGKGSRHYGKTSDYLESMNIILSDGEVFDAKIFSKAETEQLLKEKSRAGKCCQEIIRVIRDNESEIESVFPKMNRGLTGYNLQRVLLPDGSFNPMRLLAGSEGTLAFTQEVTLKVKELPRFKRLVVIRYSTFETALAHIETLLQADPLAIEILDDRVLDTARDDISWQSIEPVLGGPSPCPVNGLNFVEFVGDDLAALQAGMAQIKTLCEGQKDIIDFRLVDDEALIEKLWSLRASAVGLLGRPIGDRQAIPFIEDTAVPPQALPAYVKEFRATLDQYHLSYGMFGHADVGCLHVRPFMNMLSAQERALIRPMSEKLVALTKKYGGVLWGEHGRGVRGEFLPVFFGEKLFPELCRIKAAFDPNDLFNRGKLVPLNEHKVIKIDEMPLRGTFDEQIKPSWKQIFAKAINCNGNGACFNQEPSSVMCPSYKATKNRLYSPKGRTALLKEWLRLNSLPQKSPDRKQIRPLEKTLKRSLSTCLACKACSSQCPLKIDIPQLRSLFLQQFYRFRLRPIKDYAIAFLETFLKIGRVYPALSNKILGNKTSKMLLSLIGLVDIPRFTPVRLPESAFLTTAWLSEENSRKLLILQDSYTSSFEGQLVEDSYFVFRALGYDVKVSPVWDNGKACHVLGFRSLFAHAARDMIANLRPVSENGIPIVSLDAATGLMFQKEYREIGKNDQICVQSLEAFLLKELKDHPPVSLKTVSAIKEKTLIPHCTAQALTPETGTQWCEVFALFGLKMSIKQTGCCGMAGLFGHERDNAALSKKLFSLNWNDLVTPDTLATGFSCRCQTKRMKGAKLQHPIEVLRSCLEK
ncbi:FAD-binding and (Fe-S)-binding domain-containing protein [Acetobacteraceae bacterium ESL0709]|nr:FAD-binding and (Fe-S)-binding domain-containing protein [Acetobacteraceae bacterium ESL0697]MDF7678169.1 FAD-binding and (Fe-S)-binding domain-containing protein [Acetobacteraceae bacterium ESL0709]